MTPIIEIKNIGKRYNIIGHKRGYVALRDIITEKILHPLLSIKKLISRILGTNRDEIFWALKDVSFNVEKGEAVGIIGSNGAGKSTLLKILSRITPPSEGEIKLNGRVASLLEVGTGFHPELSGRENIYLNGAILGMTRKEIGKKFEAIVDFSGIGDFIDTPVKRYSTGMYVRLAFSIAAHIEPDILLVDEVLAVGDAEFQKKCLGKMEEVTGKAGRTILFVSHNMSAVEKLCPRSILLSHGKIVKSGPTKEVIEYYLREEYDKSSGKQIELPITEKDLVIHKFDIIQKNIQTVHIDSDSPFKIEIDFEILRDLTLFRTGIYITNALGEVLVRSFIADWKPELEKINKGRYLAVLTFPEKLLMPGNYLFTLHASRYSIIDFIGKYNVRKSVTFMQSAHFNQAHPNEPTGAKILIKQQWELNKLNKKI